MYKLTTVALKYSTPDPAPAPASACACPSRMMRHPRRRSVVLSAGAGLLAGLLLAGLLLAGCKTTDAPRAEISRPHLKSAAEVLSSLAEYSLWLDQQGPEVLN